MNAACRPQRLARTLRRATRLLSVEEKRKLKQEAKLQEMARARHVADPSATISAGINMARSSKSASPPKSTFLLQEIRKMGFRNWLNITWYGNRMRGGGMRSTFAALLKTGGVLFILVGPIAFFFYDDGKAAFTTRVATCEAFRDIPSVSLLDVGTGNGELSRMLAREVEDLQGSVVSVDIDGVAIAWARVEAKKQKLTNVTYQVLDVLDLRDLKTPFSHACVSMCLHELDPVRRVAFMHAVSQMVEGGKLVVLDFTTDARGIFSLSQFRNVFFELFSGHYSNFVHWVTSGGLPALVDTCNEETSKLGLKMAPLKLTETVLLDRGTHAVFVIEVGEAPNPEMDRPEKKSSWLPWL
ncbi:hypothetical protein DIPPA_30279 [Diplonema papillatum]|nr:hypothetical protein DIPPA_30279 [Diplonema papillatum]